MEICIPSYKRPTKCFAAAYLTKATICVHESEVKAYRKNNKNKVKGIPDGLAGKGMAVIRNWMVANAESDDVMMVDDDVKYVGYFEGAHKSVYGEQQYMFRMGEDKVYEVMQNGFRMARELGTVLWGLNNATARKFYREYSPFSMLVPICGTVMGVIRDGNRLRFDEELGLKEDFEYSIQVLNRYRKILRFNKYHYMAEHLTAKGGCGAYRTLMAELRQQAIMKHKWGGKIVTFRKGRTDPIIRVPIPGI